MTPSMDAVRRLVRQALAEDGGTGDATTSAVVPLAARARGLFLAKQDLVIAGLAVARETFLAADPEILWEELEEDGAQLAAGRMIARVTGSAHSLLRAERVALNFLQRMSGVATLTRRFVDAVAGTRARIRDTRKTTPLLRELEKYAVVVGGGELHRKALDQAILVKDNHVRLAGSVAEAARRAREGSRGLLVEVEVEQVGQIEAALAAGADMLLLDNFTPELARAGVTLVRGRVPVEASGGIRLDNVRAYAEAGVDFIAVGALTHSAPAADISLEIEPT